eukprot:5799437-Pleurochrysis_carterae.AAC.1
MPKSLQIPGCGDRADDSINGRSSRENGIGTRKPCRVECHLVTVSQGKGKGKCYGGLTPP